MARVTRAFSIVLLAAGIVFVFAGLNLAIGWSTIGVAASTAAVAALLYSGAIWFGSSSKPATALDTVVVFDHSLRVASGARRGASLASCFPAPVRADVESHCTAALGGAGGRFSCEAQGDQLQFDVVPVRASDGRIVYGLLMTDVKLTSRADRAGGIV